MTHTTAGHKITLRLFCVLPEERMPSHCSSANKDENYCVGMVYRRRHDDDKSRLSLEDKVSVWPSAPLCPQYVSLQSIFHSLLFLSHPCFPSVLWLCHLIRLQREAGVLFMLVME